MKRIMIRETLYSGSSVSIVSTGTGPILLKRVTNDGSPKFNTIILYEEGDEIYEHWDAMYCWEEPEKLKVSKASMSLTEYFKELTPKAIDATPSVLLDEMRREYAYKIGWKPEKEKLPKLVIKNLTEG